MGIYNQAIDLFKRFVPQPLITAVENTSKSVQRALEVPGGLASTQTGPVDVSKATAGVKTDGTTPTGVTVAAGGCPGGCGCGAGCNCPGCTGSKDSASVADSEGWSRGTFASSTIS